MIKGLLLMFTTFLAIVSGIAGYTKEDEKVYYPMMLIFTVITAIIGVYM